MGIQNRCNKPISTSYPRYGAKGIKCLWNSFEEFRDDMYESYLSHVKEHGERNTTIERKDSAGNYCKDNCRWATLKEQARNTKRNVFIEYLGETKCIADWADLYKVNRTTLWYRLYKHNWPIDKALTTVVKR